MTQSPARHFRTSAQSGLFAEAIATLLRRTDAELGHPDPFTVVDIGAGDAELLTALLRIDDLDGRLRPVAVELRPRPDELDPRIQWRNNRPPAVTGLVLACELLDNVPCDVVEVDDDSIVRYELVYPDSGVTVAGAEVSRADADWLARWWPITEPGQRAEIGLRRDRAWFDIVATVHRGAALAIDYGHTIDRRPELGTLTGFSDGHQVPPVPDGSGDITAHVAMDSLGPGVLKRQTEALRELGIDGSRPPMELARSATGEYLRRLSRASEAADLTDPAGLGSHWWLHHTVSPA